MNTESPSYSVGDAVYFRGREYEVVAISDSTPTAMRYEIKDIYDGGRTEASEVDLLSNEP